MKTTLTALAIALTALLSAAPAAAQQSITGTYKVEKLNSTEPPESIELRLTFKPGETAVLELRSKGTTLQVWEYTYSYKAIQNELTLELKAPLGKADQETYEASFKKGKLLLLPPKPAKTETEDDKAEDDKEDKDAEKKDEAAKEAEGEENESEKADEKKDDEKKVDEKKDASADKADDKKVESKTDTEEKGDTKPDKKDADDADAGTPDKDEPKEEEDTREPIWILVSVD